VDWDPNFECNRAESGTSYIYLQKMGGYQIELPDLVIRMGDVKMYFDLLITLGSVNMVKFVRSQKRRFCVDLDPPVT
jgi:hypothetical protein